jgi:hypothetical protein
VDALEEVSRSGVEGGRRFGSEWGTISTSKFEKFLGFVEFHCPNPLFQFVLSSLSSEDLDTDGLLTEDRRGFCLKTSKDADAGTRRK